MFEVLFSPLYNYESLGISGLITQSAALVSVSHNIFVKRRGRVQTRQVSQELPGAGSHAVMCPATVPRQLCRVSFITEWISFVMTLLYCCTHTTQTLQTPECLISSEQVAGLSS